MGDRERVELGAVQETLLIPLYARATETRRPHPMLVDERAVEMVGAIDYDFDRFGRGPSLVGCVLRSLIFDEWVRAFLREHPGGTVVEIGAGLDTRFERLDNGTAHWVEFDLPDTMALRRRFFAGSERRTLFDGSVLDDGWIAAATARPGPYLLVAEAVLFYLPERDVRAALRQIADRFAGASVAFDTGGALMVRHQDRHDTLRHMSARMQWECGEPRDVESLEPRLRLVESKGLYGVPEQAMRTLPWTDRVVPWLVGFSSIPARYRMNLFAVSG